MEINPLRIKKLGIDTHQQPIVYIRSDCPLCRSEGFNALSRLRLTCENTSIIATLNVVSTDSILKVNQVGVSNIAAELLEVCNGDVVTLSHPKPLQSLGYLRSKIYGQRLNAQGMKSIVDDIAADRYADVQLAAFITACVDKGLDTEEVGLLTRAMTEVGERLSWEDKIIVDKHCVGGLPGNRTSPIIVAIVAACGLTMPKTSSRAITSPAGTADCMEVLAPVSLDLDQMKSVIEKEGACIVWGGSVNLSPADDALIRVERALDLDSEGQLVASVLSKKLAAGSSHVVIDIPVGPTAKVRDQDMADRLSAQLRDVGRSLGLQVDIVLSDGSQPVGYGIGPALEAEDVLAVLSNDSGAPLDLRMRALQLAGRLLETAGVCELGKGYAKAEAVLNTGLAYKKFIAICEAQGGFSLPPAAEYSHPVFAERDGLVTHIDNRILARLAKFAGAPAAKSAGIKILVHLGEKVEKETLLFTLYSESVGELNYALDYMRASEGAVVVGNERV